MIYEGIKSHDATYQFCLGQLTHEPAQIIGESSSSTHLIFTFQANLIMKSDVQSYYTKNCHHDIVFARFGLKEVYFSPNVR